MVRLPIHVTASARRNHVGGQHDGALRVRVTAVADKGKANKAIMKLLAKTLGLSISQFEIISGHTNRRKVLEIHEAPDNLAATIEQLQQLES
ncbi:DUF167 domain-containing protein [Rubripirellula amarantea]|uniref:UPF0235 protein Pla22_27110 n=1 Tax=Rubripirellula amarantea TaxID=2527999 RepID=A0A5C5WWH6_9BACT|nr:DUF167 domain-containing protein [Rubripirellula amarantea]MDA8745014.1 DUF167 domain-containing protein [Rubripirellula amarantea]TWT55057.1 hypothetical protein Pla22_27110 [Rubripirellula amarantea]